MTTRPAPSTAIQSALVAALRGERPPDGASGPEVDDCLRLYECGGYLHHAWKERGGGLPEPWAGAAARAHHKTLVDNLAAMAQLREVGAILADERAPFILLKGAAYLVDLFGDPGSRALTDIDLLLRHDDAMRVARRLAALGFRGEVGAHYPEDRRFEMYRMDVGSCRFEFHWSLGVPGRMRIDQEEIWRDARPAVLEGVKGLSLSPEVALLFHVGHQADHYFGPTLKWVLDLREMLRRWAPDPARVAQKSRAWGLRTALDLALAHLEKILPGEDKVLRSAVPPDRLKRRLMGPFLSHEPIPLFHPDRSPVASLALRPLLFDRLTDLVFVSMQVATRPPARLWGRLAGRVPRPWDGAGGAD